MSSQPPRIHRDIGPAGFFTRIQFLVLGLETHAAGFQQQDIQPGVRQRQRQRNSRRSAADDRQIGRQHLAGGKRAGVKRGGQNCVP